MDIRRLFQLSPGIVTPGIVTSLWQRGLYFPCIIEFPIYGIPLHVRIASYFMTERLDSITPDLCLVILWRVGFQYETLYIHCFCWINLPDIMPFKH